MKQKKLIITQEEGNKMHQPNKPKKNTEHFRVLIQSIALLLQNANWKGFFTGKIYQGNTKYVCVPGLNCYSCPGAVMSCPIGALQNSLSSFRFRFPYYVLGLLFGRIICGFLCPIGFLQDLIYRIPFVKKIKTFPGDKYLRYLKYLVLLVMVVILPIIIKLTPFFCKYLCPSGTVAGLLLSITDHRLVQQFGALFTWKVIVLAFLVILSLILYRPFCKYLCPLGAFYAPFNKIALLQMKTDKEKCTGCGACKAVCNMCVDPSKTPNSMECIRCGKCISCCPENAISYSACNAESIKSSQL